MTALFPPGKGGGAEIAYGFKRKGVLIHLLVDAEGMPVSAAVTPADGDERKQAEHLVETVVVKTRKPGRPPKKIKRIAGDKGYDSQKLRAFLLSKGIAPQIPRKKNAAPRFHIERTFGSRENSAAWLFDGRGCRNASIPFSRSASLFFGCSD